MEPLHDPARQPGGTAMSDPDRIISSVPVNKTAARVLGRGVHWEPKKKLLAPEQTWQDTPLPVLALPIGAHAEHNLTGMRVCRLTVLGYGGRGSNSARWTVRCTCGKYGHQKAKFLRSEIAKTEGMCPWCRHLEQLKSGNVPSRAARP